MSTTKSMRNIYKGMSLYAKDEYESIWNDSIIVLDTNILLNLYRYSEETRKNILNCLKTFKNRIWIPYQVIKEYYKNRDKVIDDCNLVTDELKSIIDAKYGDIYKELNKRAERAQAVEEIKKIIEKNQQDLLPIFQKFKSDETKEKKLANNLAIEKEICELIKDSFEEEYEYKDIESVIEEGDYRIKNSIPPGYMDNEKKEQYNNYKINGDYIILNSIIKKAKENNKSVIFITDDQKEDWFQIANHKTLGGRCEILQEFYKETGNLMLIYTAKGFIDNYNHKSPKKPIPEATVKEIEKINTEGKWTNITINNDYINNNSYIRYMPDYSNRELSASEKRMCLQEILKRIEFLISIYQKENLSMEATMLNANEILLNIDKVDKYYILGYKKNYGKIRVYTQSLAQALYDKNYDYFYKTISNVLEELNKIIDNEHIEIAFG